MNLSVVDSSLMVSMNWLFYYRLFVFLFSTYAYISHFIGTNTSDIVDALSWFKFLTHWDSMNICIYFGLSCWLTLLAIKDPARSTSPLISSKLACFVHFMFELTNITAWFVSILYWTALYPIEVDPPQGYWFFINLCMHGLPALWVTIDVFIGCGVLVQFHLWMMYSYMFVYLIVNAIITVTTMDPIYAILTYKNATSVLWLGISLVLVLAIWGLTYLLIRLRTRCCSRNRARSVVVFSKDAKPSNPAPIV